MTKLIADIGGTNARFAIVDADNRISRIEVLACADYDSPADAALAYIKRNGVTPVDGAFAVATPLYGSDHVGMTNHIWSFSIEETRRKTGLASLKVINDFTALALSIPYLLPDHFVQISDRGAPRAGQPIGIIGPGTGLGVAAVVFDTQNNPIAIPTEGGHVTMPATTQREFDIFTELMRSKYHHISAERVVSGKGLVNLYNAISTISKVKAEELAPAEITARGTARSCAICAEAVDLFCHFLGVTAGNLALTYGAFGGIYIAGGIVPQLGSFFTSSAFRESFESKGRFRDYLSNIPTYLVTHPFPGLEGLKYG